MTNDQTIDTNLSQETVFGDVIDLQPQVEEKNTVETLMECSAPSNTAEKSTTQERKRASSPPTDKENRKNKKGRKGKK